MGLGCWGGGGGGGGYGDAVNIMLNVHRNFWRERRAEAESGRGPSAYQPNALPLGQTSSHRDNQ